MAEVYKTGSSDFAARELGFGKSVHPISLSGGKVQIKSGHFLFVPFYFFYPTVGAKIFYLNCVHIFNHS